MIKQTATIATVMSNSVFIQMINYRLIEAIFHEIRRLKG